MLVAGGKVFPNRVAFLGVVSGTPFDFSVVDTGKSLSGFPSAPTVTRSNKLRLFDAAGSPESGAFF